MKDHLFHGLLYAFMGIMGVLGLVLVIWRREWTRDWMKFYARSAQRFARWVYGIEVEIRGPIPQDNVLIAAKHQSMFDVLILYSVLPEPRFVMKRELLWAPVFGLYAWRVGCVPVDRRPQSGSSEKIVQAFSKVTGQLAVYPQGTRVPPGERAPYRRGIARLHHAIRWPIVPVATNSGLFWGRKGEMTGPGTVVVEFLDRMPENLEGPELMAALERRIETASDRLANHETAADPD